MKLDSNFKWLVIGEIIVVLFIVVIYYIYKRINDYNENKKIDKVLKYIDKKAKDNDDVKERIDECIEIIKQCEKEDK